MVQQATESPQRETRRGRYWRLVSRFAAASAVATAVSQVVFVASYSLGAPPAVATVLAWLGGAIPNFELNRRTWGGGDRAALRGEILRYGVISVVTAVLAAFATSGADHLAAELFPAARVAVVWGAYVGTYAVMFVIKFVLVDRLVFTDPSRRRSR